METFEQWRNDSRFDVDLCKGNMEAAWNAALESVNSTLDPSTTVGDVEDTVRFLKTENEEKLKQKDKQDGNMKLDENKKYQALPDIVHTILVFHRAWLVGSGAHWFIEGADLENMPRDWDLITSQAEFPRATKRINSQARKIEINSMGGIKAQVGGQEIDIWTDTLARYTEKAESMRFGELAAVRLNPRVEFSE